MGLSDRGMYYIDIFIQYWKESNGWNYLMCWTGLITGNRNNVEVILIFNFRVAGSIYVSEGERITVPYNVRGETQNLYVTIQVIFYLDISIKF